MRSDLPKVLLPLCGRPMLAYVLDVLAEVGILRPIIVVAESGESVIRDAVGDGHQYVLQEEQLGSGHAVLCAREVARTSENVLVMCGDSPLFLAETVRSLIRSHVSEQAVAALTSAALTRPEGYGRVLRTKDGNVAGVVEEVLATDEQKEIKEVNGGCYAFDGPWLWENIGGMSRNEIGEYCLTEMVDMAIQQGERVVTVSAKPDEVAGVNTPAQLLEAEAVLRARPGGQ